MSIGVHVCLSILVSSVCLTSSEIAKTGHGTAIWLSNPAAGHTHPGNQNWKKHMFPNVPCSTIHSSILTWRIPWTKEPGRLQSMRSLESDTTERLRFHFSLSCIGEGNGNPLQCSCLENPRDGEAWWAAVYGSHRVRHDGSDIAAAYYTKLIHYLLSLTCACMYVQRSVMSDCSLPTSSVHRIPQVRILEWVAMPSYRGSSLPRDQTLVPWIGRQILYHLIHQRSPCACIVKVFLKYFFSFVCFQQLTLNLSLSSR